MEEKLIKIFCNIFNVNENEISNKSSPENLENWDSLTHMDLVVSVEEEFEIRLTSDEIIEMKNFKMIKELLASKI
jgi:acyl carrier protein